LASIFQATVIAQDRLINLDIGIKFHLSRVISCFDSLAIPAFVLSYSKARAETATPEFYYENLNKIPWKILIIGYLLLLFYFSLAGRGGYKGLTLAKFRGKMPHMLSKNVESPDKRGRGLKIGHARSHPWFLHFESDF